MKKPIVHLYAISYNEEVLMPHFLKYYSCFCQKIHIYDNCSDDSTQEICKSFQNVTVFSFDTNNQIRDDIYMKIKNESWKKSRGIADFVIVCDIDEFIYSDSVLIFLEKALIQGVSLIKSVGYNMVSDELPNRSSDIFKDFPYGTRSSSFDKILIFNPNLIEDINYNFGAHTCCPIGALNYSTEKLFLLHYKYLSIQYIQERYKLFNLRLSNFNKKLNLGYHYSFSAFRIKREFKAIKTKSIKVLDQLQ
jgi:hypothetical protein